MQVDSEHKLSRRERERCMRRREILHAAQIVFAEKGYANATLDEIAHRAEFGKGTLYNYFGGKEDILFAVFDEIYDDLCGLIQSSFTEERVAGRPLRTVFVEFVQAYLDFFVARQELFLILIKEVHRMTFSDDSERVAYILRQRDRVVGALVPALEARMATGELKPLDPTTVAHLIIGNINGLQMHMSLAGCAGNRTEPSFSTTAEAAEFLTTMLFDGLHASPS